MLTILLHSSKTMRTRAAETSTYQAPTFLNQAEEIAAYLQTLTSKQLARSMKLSDKKAYQTRELLSAWTTDPDEQVPAIDAFLGDIYSGLQAADFTEQDRMYANKHLLILSGLYGGLRALDSICPYRLEMGYTLPKKAYANLYSLWGKSIATLIPERNDIVNLSAVEYTKAVLPYVSSSVTIITPKFLTMSSKTKQPEFVTVHAKIARGAFAHWLIKNKVTDVKMFKDYTDIGYHYDKTLSSPTEPVFVCDQFGGLGLSIRLT